MATASRWQVERALKDYTRKRISHTVAALALMPLTVATFFLGSAFLTFSFDGTSSNIWQTLLFLFMGISSLVLTLVFVFWTFETLNEIPDLTMNINALKAALEEDDLQ